MAIDLREAIGILESGQWVALRFMTCNVQRGTGGKVMELARCKIARRQPGPKDATGDKSAATYPEKKRSANHNLNMTRNVELQNRDIITVHPILITHINHQAVL